MNKLMQALTTSIGSKVLMALTGLSLVGFVVIHMLGNLQVYEGPDALNRYAHTLRESPVLLWTARLGLLTVFVLHIVESIHLKLINRRARPTAYVYDNTARASLASRTMLFTGAVILAFVIFHLLHFTFGIVQTENFGRLDEQGRKDVYTMVTRGFQNPVICAVYVIAMAFLGVHLSHGASSFFHSLGVRHPKYDPLIYSFGLVISVLIVLGNISIPLIIFAGLPPHSTGGTP